MGNYSNKFELSTAPKLKDFFITEGAEISDCQHALWRAKTKNYVATFYNTGKFLIQGADITDIVTKVENFLNISAQTVQESREQHSFVKKIGVDESGKGDFFGPLVIAGVLVDENNYELFRKAGVKDCKMVDDKNINKLAALIKNNSIFSVVTISPTKYNELYAKLKNLNKLLAWGHARAIENILEKTDCSYALSDKFGDEKLIKNALLKKGRNIHLEQRCKAESDMAVAAASIVARAGFLSCISEISSKYGIEIPKGANARVIEAARQISSKYSKSELINTSKIHFKTFEQV